MSGDLHSYLLDWGFVHALLRNKIVALAFLCTLFAALAGLGLGFLLDYVNRDRPRRLAGWFLLGACLPLSALFAVLLGIYG